MKKVIGFFFEKNMFGLISSPYHINTICSAAEFQNQIEDTR